VAPAGRYPAPHPYGARTFLRFRGGRPADWRMRHRSAGRRRSRRKTVRGVPAVAQNRLIHCSFSPFMGMCRARGLACFAALAATGGSLKRLETVDRRSLPMKKMLALSLALAAAVSVSACQTPQQTNALAGGALGGGAGALIGSAVSGGSAGGTLAGAAIGAASGAMIGAAATPQPTYAAGSSPPGCAQWPTITTA